MRDLWPLVAGGIIVLGLALQNAALVAVGVAVGLASGGALLWSRYALRRLTYERITPEDHGFPGETLGMTLRITNQKRLPLTWIDIRDLFPDTMLEPDADNNEEVVPVAQAGYTGLEWRTATGAHERVSRDVALRCPARGVYQAGPVELRSGDPFGLFTEGRIESGSTRLVVYPRIVDLPELHIPSRRPYGEYAGGLRIFEDPSRIAGVRDYRSGDSLRRIDWNATARTGRLQSRIYDPSSSQQMLVCLNVQTVVPAWSGHIAALLERSITAAASIARDAYTGRYAVGLIANCTFPDAAASVRVPPGRRPEQFIRLLESLAIVTPYVLEPLSTLLDREEYRLPVGTTVTVVTAIMTGDLAATLRRLHRRNHAVVVLSTSGDLWSEQLGSIPVRDVSDIDAPVWRRPVAVASDDSANERDGGAS